MAGTWTRPKPFDATDVYRDWFDHVYKPGTSGAFGYETVLVKIADPVADNLAWLAATADAATEGSDFVMDAQERARLAALIADTPDWALDLFVHRRRSVVDFWAKYAARFTFLPDGAARPTLPAPERPTVALTPVVAVIDDAIGWLNARFTRQGNAGLETRLEQVWLQASDAFDAAGHMVCGRELAKSEIDALLAQGAALDEAAVYMDTNISLYGHRDSPVWHGLTAGPGTELAITHGTHVTDIAAGSDPLASDAIADCPLLAAQLPPQAVEDTSGAQLTPYLLRALRWIFDQADALAVNGVARPVIVNVSIGVLAGSKDGTSLLERQVAAEVLRREARTGTATRVVLAFGNDNLTRQIAHCDLAADATELTLRVQSEDYTPSFVELRPDRPDDLRLSIAGLGASPLALRRIAPGKMVSLKGPDGDVARVYSVPSRALDGGGATAAWYLLALAPTAAFEVGKPIAGSGVWTIGLASVGDPQPCRIAVQRDDRPMGFAALARQSYLDDHALWEWKKPEKTPFAPPSDGPVTRRGCHSAYVSEEAPDQVYSVGAALSNTGFAAPYTATGAPWVAHMPGVSAIGDSSWTLRGVMASGTLSGTTAVIGGTSVAAPQITRQLALYHATGPDAGPWLDPVETRSREMAALAALEWSFVPTYEIDQLGLLNVSLEAGLRPRLDDGFA